MRKKIALLLVLCMLVCTACGTEETDTHGDATGASQSTAAVQTESVTTSACATTQQEINTTQRQEATVTSPVAVPTVEPTQNVAPTTSAGTKQPATTNRPTATEAGHVHSWVAATCEMPKHCECGATIGKARGHYYNAATCEKAKECIYCYQTSGKPLGHVFMGQATCEEGDRCSRCKYIVNSTALGHNYNSDGICQRCDKADPDHMDVFKVGETWRVEGLWEFTITSVSRHYACNPYAGFNGQVVIINYTYKNLGIENGVKFDLLDFEIYDEEGEIGGTHPCTHTESPKSCAIGMKCSAGKGIELNNNSSKFTIIVEQHTNVSILDNLHAKFEIDIP